MHTHQRVPHARVLIVEQRGIGRGPLTASQLAAQVVGLRRRRPQ